MSRVKATTAQNVTTQHTQGVLILGIPKSTQDMVRVKVTEYKLHTEYWSTKLIF